MLISEQKPISEYDKEDCRKFLEPYGFRLIPKTRQVYDQAYKLYDQAHGGTLSRSCDGCRGKVERWLKTNK